MAGIFSGHAFGGIGQTTSDAEFSSLISSLASRPPSATASAIMTGATGGKGAPASVSEIWASPAPVSSDNTVLYVIGGVAVVGILAALFMMNGGRRVASNRRSNRSRR